MLGAMLDKKTMLEAALDKMLCLEPR